MSSGLPYTPEQLLATPIGTLAQESAEVLFHLKNAAADLYNTGKALTGHIDRALDFKWKDRAHSLRLEAGKNFGVIHFEEGDVRVTADLTKKVGWDQARLAQMASRIAANGEDPTQYLEIEYRVAEAKFNAWPETLKSAFEAARTVAPGKASYRLALIKE